MRYEVTIKKANGDYDFESVKARTKSEARRIVERSLEQVSSSDIVESVEEIEDDWELFYKRFDPKNIYGPGSWEEK